LGKWFQKAAPEGVRVLGPCTAPIARIKGTYRFHLILKASSRKALNTALRKMLAHAEAEGVPRRNLVVDVDALRLM
jgi:primosomal protein N' (replication factor Y)